MLDVIEQVVALVVVDAQALLLDKRVVAHGIQLKARGQSDRSQGAMQRQGDVIRLGHVGDLAGFGNTTRVGGIRLNDIDVPLAQYALEVPAREQPFTQSDRGVSQRRELFEGFVVLAQHGLFDEHELVRIEFLHQYLGHGLVYATMEVDADADIRADRIAHSGDVGQGQIDLVEGIEKLQFFGAVHLHCGKTTGDRLFGCTRGVCRAIAADP